MKPNTILNKKQNTGKQQQKKKRKQYKLNI